MINLIRQGQITVRLSGLEMLLRFSLRFCSCSTSSDSRFISFSSCFACASFSQGYFISWLISTYFARVQCLFHRLTALPDWTRGAQNRVVFKTVQFAPKLILTIFLNFLLISSKGLKKTEDWRRRKLAQSEIFKQNGKNFKISHAAF